MAEVNPELRTHRPSPTTELPLFESRDVETLGEDTRGSKESLAASLPSGRKLSGLADRGGASALPGTNQAHARKTDPITSHQSAASVTNLGPTRDRIINILYSYGPLTDEQIWKRYQEAFEKYTSVPRVSPSGLRSRRSELVRFGLVYEAGFGKTQSGRNCQVWRLKK